ncbi:hydroxymethylbilane synthase [Legionella bononiensis]|uniref:Porphobilinogen deaminase n=1 Tax=Legionella bononiensis TaxID=2793102 RepID=A0ABS1W9Y5_9GAMM|nr:hydroxymethylbilane synthase [Legionella bononiensis]MBL7480641.1 hydroxymethylbilane synthase [Legionella bononiensis]MBL7526160.1 hydroxymethylbilane synthase [Legionella bononiensis]MBL7563345.1 hydroxymethylbilane synthase [Legionella bononiensis]
MKPKTIRIATRQSPLALWQANHVRETLLKQWPSLTIELLPMVTSGDKFLKDKLLVAGGKGLFVKELEEALLDKRADFAVHSTKDMPAELPSGLSLAAICKRHNPYDALVSTKFTHCDELPLNAIVGTSSLRRQSQLLAYRPDLQIKTLRGNINTRLAKLEAGEYDAIILAAAGLERMGLEQSITELLSDDIMLPACGQGALCIECRSDDQDIQKIIGILNDPVSSLCVHTERTVNAQLGGNCHVPLAVFCKMISDSQLQLKAKILNPIGSLFIDDTQTGTMEQAHQLAMQCSQNLLNRGAAKLLDTLSE